MSGSPLPTLGRSVLFDLDAGSGTRRPLGHAGGETCRPDRAPLAPSAELLCARQGLSGLSLRRRRDTGLSKCPPLPVHSGVSLRSSVPSPGPEAHLPTAWDAAWSGT